MEAPRQGDFFFSHPDCLVQVSSLRDSAAFKQNSCSSEIASGLKLGSLSEYGKLPANIELMCERSSRSFVFNSFEQGAALICFISNLVSAVTAVTQRSHSRIQGLFYFPF